MSRRVLIARDATLCGQLPDLLAAAGYDTCAVPVTTTEFIQPIKFHIADHEWVAFTSANGVAGLSRALTQSSQTIPDRMQIAVVGDKTSAAVRKHFQRDANLISKIPDGIHLASTLAEALSTGTSLLYPCAAEHEPVIEDICRSNGILVTELPVYRTLHVSPEILKNQLLSLQPFDVVVFYAPSAVRAFHAALPTGIEYAAVAIGPTTMFALEETGCKAIEISASPEAPALAEAVSRAFKHFTESSNV